jgi:hypothetical protein
MGHAELVEALRGGPLRTSFDKLRMTQQMSFPFQNSMDLINQDDKINFYTSKYLTTPSAQLTPSIAAEIIPPA